MYFARSASGNHLAERDDYCGRTRIAIYALLLAIVACCGTPARGQSLDWLRPAMPFARSGGAPLATSAQPHPAVARIIVQERDGIAFGSGTLIDAQGDQGLVITNWHVVRDAAGDIEVEFPDGHRSKAKVLKMDKDWDLAALVIWKPNVAPVALSTAAPQPGDVLTIAGYGSGNFRAATARCTQYVSPGKGLPYEMVELGCEARQGDSGGPILNDRGEIAGVLFGAGGGTTSGSYVGRVKTFLASVSPRDPSSPGNIPAINAENIAGTNPFVNSQGVPYLVQEANARVASAPPKVSLEQPSTTLPVNNSRSTPAPNASAITPLADEMEAIPSPAPRAVGSSHLVTFGALPDRTEFGSNHADLQSAPQERPVPLWSRPLPNARPSVSSATNETLDTATPAAESRRKAPTDLAAILALLGPTLGEQVKGLLAIVGVGAVVLRFCRSPKSAA